MSKNLAEVRGFKNAAIGTIMAWTGGNGDIPHGWLECDGGTYQNANYPLLKDVIGYTYGGSDQSGDFQVPNLNNGRVPFHKGSTYTGQGGNNTDNVGLYAQWNVDGRPNKTISYNSSQVQNSGNMWSQTAYVQPRVMSLENVPAHGHNQTVNTILNQYGGTPSAESGGDQTFQTSRGMHQKSTNYVGCPNDDQNNRFSVPSGAHSHSSVSYDVNPAGMQVPNYQEEYTSDNISLNNNPGLGNAALDFTPPYQTAIYIIKAY
tara:strand:+ start:217 stop:999 length:783 start_codon:yes stop_codon:yes gene_type:complete